MEFPVGPSFESRQMTLPGPLRRLPSRKGTKDSLGPWWAIGIGSGRGSRANRIPAGSEQGDQRRDLVEIPVGISRLHMVSLPLLQMKPIYWSPVNDISIVLRATWFYEDSMTPVDAPIANQLEAGYRELRPWTETWSDEIKSALRVGPEGEEKVSHRLWPEAPSSNSKMTDGFAPEPPISGDPFCAARCFRGEAAAEGTLEPVHPAEDYSTQAPEARSYANYHVIYKDQSKAFLLKPSLKPSAYYSRRPIAKIMRGVTVGIPVVRGSTGMRGTAFTRRSQHPVGRRAPRPPVRSMPSFQGIFWLSGLPARQKPRRNYGSCSCRPRYRTEVLERVESYSFTLAINAFRRAVNVELENQEVKTVLRDGQGGIMVLPVNWRLAVSLEDEDVAENDGPLAKEDFTLKDIEPNSIKAVRGIISEVMFDIPFYMSSKHKPKMTAALVTEANRIMRLWTRNHAGERTPRVHFIGHSLGSVMLMDVLSSQPTSVPAPDPRRELDTKHFEFGTTNLFLLGSPTGFFLLLERGNLSPRRGRQKAWCRPQGYGSRRRRRRGRPVRMSSGRQYLQYTCQRGPHRVQFERDDRPAVCCESERGLRSEHCDVFV